MHRLTVPVLERMLEAGRAQPELTDEALTAMVAYLGMLREWRPSEPVAPDPPRHRRGAPLGSRRASTVRPGRTATPQSTVSADHLTILEDQADASARAIEDWLSATAPGPRRGRLGKLLRR